MLVCHICCWENFCPKNSLIVEPVKPTETSGEYWSGKNLKIWHVYL